MHGVSFDPKLTENWTLIFSEFISQDTILDTYHPAYHKHAASNQHFQSKLGATLRDLEKCNTIFCFEFGLRDHAQWHVDNLRKESVEPDSKVEVIVLHCNNMGLNSCNATILIKMWFVFAFWNNGYNCIASISSMDILAMHYYQNISPNCKYIIF